MPCRPTWHRIGRIVRRRGRWLASCAICRRSMMSDAERSRSDVEMSLIRLGWSIHDGPLRCAICRRELEAECERVGQSFKAHVARVIAERQRLSALGLPLPLPPQRPSPPEGAS